jgi:hypothetical protein
MSLTVALMPEAEPPTTRASTINNKHLNFIIDGENKD